VKLSILALVAAAAAGFVLAVVTAPGCASNCGENCPVTTVYIGSSDNHELNGTLGDIEVNGPACPPRYSVLCVGDMSTTACTHTTITGTQAGWCDVEFVFGDRPTEILHLEFGPTMNANGSCCNGNPVIGPSVYIIPDKPTGPIYSGTPGTPSYSTDAITIVRDAAADAPGDAGADSLLPDAE
jgi:hypothetical protein